MLGEHAPREVKELVTGGEFEGELVLGLKLETSVKFDLGG